MPKYDDRASCKHLTHKYASFHGCTLEEMGIILGFYAIVELPILIGLSLMLGAYLGGFWGAFLLQTLFFALLTFFILLKQTAKRVGKIRKGRPAGYLKLRFRQIMNEKCGTCIPYVIRNGKCSVVPSPELIF